MSDGDKIDGPESEMESEISMGETRRRIHTLLDDTFTALKKYQKNLLADEPSDKSKLPKYDSHDSVTSSVPRKFAGMLPALPEPDPAHGRTAAPGSMKRRFVQNPYPVPYNQYPPAQQFNEPMLTWDPADRQRYV